jgi:hypothetical protein
LCKTGSGKGNQYQQGGDFFHNSFGEGRDAKAA